MNDRIQNGSFVNARFRSRLNDILIGTQKHDLLDGGLGNDSIFGNSGNDILKGGDDNDRLFGNQGNDVLYGDRGSDTMTGGEGNDIFVIVQPAFVSETDIITDFGNGKDSIGLQGLKFEDLNIFDDNFGNTIIQDKVSGSALAILQGVNSSSIGPEQILTFQPGDVVLDWNRIVLDAIRADGTPPPIAARNLAMVHTAVYDAVNAIGETHSIYRVDADAPEGASAEAAAATAAYRVLLNLYPEQATTFKTQLQTSLAEILDGKSETDGIALGESVAFQILAWRSTDGVNTQVDYTPGTNPGQWQPTAPNFAPALLPQFPNVTPFAMTSGDQFRPQGPPALNSAEYALEFDLVKHMGRHDSLIRTPEQTEIAHFWADGAGTFTPPGHWNQIAGQVALNEGNTLAENARLFASLNIALADAAIVAWDAKYFYDFWRPITAIEQAHNDGNPLTTADPNWDPLLNTPPFSEYVSGHSTFSGAADTILSSFFGNNVSFTDTGDPSVGIIRNFDNFTDAANEAGISRIYGGIHFQSGNEDGLAAGRALGEYVLQNFLGSESPITQNALIA
ncbi:MAG: chemotaxis protein CheB [Phormidium sp.]